MVFRKRAATLAVRSHVGAFCLHDDQIDSAEAAAVKLRAHPTPGDVDVVQIIVFIEKTVDASKGYPLPSRVFFAVPKVSLNEEL
jgi:hypothetical protein